MSSSSSSSTSIAMNTLVVPGDYLCPLKEGRSGVGVISGKGEIRASLVGEVKYEDVENNNKKRVHVVGSTTLAKNLVVAVGDIVYARVTKINYNQAFVDILTLGEQELPFPTKAVIRREDIRETEVDKVVVHEFFKPLDIVRAAVISLGDNKQYFLSTAKSGLGVIVPRG